MSGNNSPVYNGVEIKRSTVLIKCQHASRTAGRFVEPREVVCCPYWASDLEQGVAIGIYRNDSQKIQQSFKRQSTSNQAKTMSELRLTQLTGTFENGKGS